ncbi:MAG: hypothetical protein ACE5JL_16175 [Dehalococcoidia bacterium]
MLVLALVPTVMLLLGPRGAWAGESRTLSGLFGVEVVVENIKPEAERDGLTRAALQTDVELRLRQAGIRVLTKTQGLRTPGRPWLYLNVSTLKRSDGSYAYHASLGLKEYVRLERAPSRVELAETWQTLGIIGTVGIQRLHTVVREAVRDMVDAFINAYLAANPKR